MPKKKLLESLSAAGTILVLALGALVSSAWIVFLLPLALALLVIDIGSKRLAYINIFISLLLPLNVLAALFLPTQVLCLGYLSIGLEGVERLPCFVFPGLHSGGFPLVVGLISSFAGLMLSLDFVRKFRRK